jgi:hypothetical protein
MTGLRRLICVGALAAAALAATAGGASAATPFYVNQATGNDANPCTSAGAPCKTIGKAVERSEEAEGAATVEVAAGTYQELVNLSHAADNGITINGVGAATQIKGPLAATNATVRILGPGNTTTLSNLSVVNPAGDEQDGIDVGANATLDNVSVDIQNPGAKLGVFAAEIGSVVMNGGSVTMESGTTGEAAVKTVFASLSMNGTTVNLANGATGGGISAEGTTSLANVTVNLGNAAERAGVQVGAGPVSLDNLSVNMGSGSKSPRSGLEVFLAASLSASGVKVAMADPSSTSPGVIQVFSNGTLAHLEVGGAWKGPAFVSEGGTVTLSDSRLIGGAAGKAPAMEAVGTGEGPGPLIQRSVLQASPTAVPGTLVVEGGNATVDSSELLGGQSGATLVHEEGKTRTLTIAGSTIDAGVLGERDAKGVSGVIDVAGGKASTANVRIEGSILLEPQLAVLGAADKATVTCEYSDAPSQAQAATATEGAINCANGASGNTTTEPPSSLFTAPVTGYGLLPSSSAIDSVPAGAIALPFGITPSATDLAGNPRVVDGNGDCIAVQDKGALELQGHSAPCHAPPTPPAPTILLARPVAGVISALTINPSTFSAAPKGATVSKTSKKQYGAKITWRDSQAATTTFTVLLPSAGRMQGRACKKPGKANKHGRRCILYKPLGSFTHTDKAGANSLHFSGRLHGRKLPRGSYRLQAVAHNAAGNGAAASKSFTIKK